MHASLTLYANFSQSALLLNTELTNFYNGILTLVGNKLSPFLISPQILLQTLNDVEAHLTVSHPQFHIVHKDLSFFYTMSHVTLKRHSNFIFISLRIPVSMSQSLFMLFQVIEYPVPLNHTTTHTTRILKVHPFLAVSKDQQDFIEMDMAMFQQCSGDTVKHCSTILQQQSSRNPTCLSAIFFQQTYHIRQLCQFSFLKNGIQTFIHPLNSEQVLLSNISMITYSCKHSKAYSQSGCLFCVINIPCACTVSPGQFCIPPRLHKCTKSTNSTISYPVNLAFLNHFFPQHLLAEIRADSQFPSPINYSIPQLNFFEHNFSSLASSEEMIQLNLAHMVERAKSNKLIYTSLSDSILDTFVTHSRQDSFQFSLWHILTTAFPAILSITAIIVSAFTWYKNRTISSAVLCQAIPIVKSMPVLIWTPSPTTTQPPSPQFSFIIDVETITLMLQSLSFLAILIILALHFNSCCHRKCNNTRIFLEVTDGRSALLLLIKTLPLPPMHYNIIADKPVAKVSLYCNLCRPQLKLTWLHVTFQNSYHDQKLYFPDTLSLSPVTYYRLHKILQNKHHLRLCQEFKGSYDYIKLASSDLIKSDKDQESSTMYPCLSESSALQTAWE